MTLNPDQFPFRIPTVLVRQIPDFEIFSRAIKTATHANVLSSSACWMVVDEAELEHFLDMLGQHVIAPALMQHQEVALRLAAQHLKHQVNLTEHYVASGWRQGRCVPWGIVSRYPSKPYKVHWVALERVEDEPYLLLARRPICNVQVKGITAIQNKEVDCGTCLIFMRERTEQYPIVSTVEEPECPTA